jgi:GNAT superfamily N-acetyltransferase
MTLADVPATAAVTDAADAAIRRLQGRDPETLTDEELAYFHGGLSRFVERDPEGAFVAVEGERVIGFSTAVRRDSFWGLSMLFVDPEAQDRGVGRRLLEAALESATGAEVRMIMTSSDPRALRRYSRAGLDIHPAVAATGKIDRDAIPAGLPGRSGSLDDLDLVADVDAGLRGSRAEDVAYMLSAGATLQIIDAGHSRGYVLQRGKRLVMLGAGDDATAARLLWRFLGQAGAEAEIWALTARQDWAVRVALAAGLEVAPAGPLFISGLERPPGPWLASGWYF